LLARWHAVDLLEHLDLMHNNPVCFSVSLREKLGSRVVR
jgi:hypothetical protein